MYRDQVAPKPWPAAGGARPVSTALGPASSPRAWLDLPAPRAVFAVIAHVLAAACSPRAAVTALRGYGTAWHLLITPALDTPWLGRSVSGRALFARVPALADLGAVELPSVALNDSTMVSLLAGRHDDAGTVSLHTLASVAASAESAALLRIEVAHCWAVAVRPADLVAVLAAVMQRPGSDEGSMVVLRPWGEGELRQLVIEIPAEGLVAIVDDYTYVATAAEPQQFTLIAPRVGGPVLG